MKLLNKPVALLLALLLLTALLAPAAAADDGCIYIRTAEELAELSRSCSLDSWSRGKTVRLMANIDLTGTDFQPIPTFSGVFDGQGHTVSGLSVIDGGSVRGLFRYVQEGGSVRDLTVEGSVSAGDAVGGIAGDNRGTLSGCVFRGTVDGTASVGGIVGINRGTVSGCRFEGSLTGEHYAGGIVGQNLGSVVRCTNVGSVNVTEVKSTAGLEDIDPEQLNSVENAPVCTDVGGIAGFSSGVIQSCLNRGSVGYPHVGYNVGGIAGRQTGYLDGCTNEGTVLGRKDVGGIAGQMEPQLTLKYDQTALELLWGELDTLEGMISGLLTAGDEAAGALSGGLNGLSDAAAEVKDAVGALTADAAAWADGGLAQINDLSARAAWVLERLTVITDLAPGIVDQLELASGRLSTALDQAADASLLGSDAMEDLSQAADSLRSTVVFAWAALEHILNAAELLEAGMGDPEVLRQALTDLFDGLEELDTALSQATASAGEIAALLETLLLWLPGEFEGTFGEELTALSDGLDALQKALESAEDPEQLADAVADVAAGLEDSLGSAAELLDRLQGALDALTLPEKELEALRIELEAMRDALQDGGAALAAITDALGRLRLDPNPEALSGIKTELEGSLSDFRSAMSGLSFGMWNLSDGMDHLAKAGEKLADALKTLSDAGDALTGAFTLLEQAAGEVDFITKELAKGEAIQFAPLEDSLSGSAEDLDRAADGFFSSVDSLTAAVDTQAELLTGHLKDVVGQVGVITDLLQQLAGEQLNVDVEDLLEDVSDGAAGDWRSTGKISGSTNLGAVEGDVNVSGIVGSMAIEYDFDPEDDLTVSGERTLSVRYLARAVVYGCTNRGSITAKKDSCGGIVGLVDLGSVVGCLGYGSVTSTAGDCVGGIAGTSYGAVRDCWAMCTLSGRDMVGGIAGLASIVTGCRTLIDLAKGSVCVGAVAGQKTGDAIFEGNLFVHPQLAGIDGVSYEGQAEPVSYNGLRALDGLPVDFTRFTLTFTADGTVVDVVEFPYGGGPDALPAIPDKAGYTARWPELDYGCLTFSRSVEAEYVPYVTALSDGEAVPQYLVSGDFPQGSQVSVVPYLDGYTVTVTDPGGREVPFTLHWRLPGEEDCTLLVWNGEAWEEYPFTVDGRYLLADCADGSITFRLEARSGLPVWVIVAAVTLVIVILAVIVIVSARHRKKVSAK